MAAACGETVVEAPGVGGSGVGATTSTSTTTSSSSMGEGGGSAACGGFGGPECSADEYCSYPDGLCGGDDSQGVCLPRPDGCTKDCPGVCGCDGQFYCNECAAHLLGVEIGSTISCSNSGGDYSAYYWAGGLDHLIVRKADPDAGHCVMIFADAPMQNSPGYDFNAPDTWGVSHAIITDQAADCAAEPGQMMGQAVDAIGGTGTLGWTVAPGMYAPCELDVDATITFNNAPAWVPPSVILDAAGVSVEGACM